MRAFCCWSGGKDSALACYRAMRQGHRIEALLTMFNAGGRYTRSHRLPRELLLAQAEALGIPLVGGRASWKGYEGEFRRLVARLRERGIEAGVFGDLYLPEHRRWTEGICAELGLEPLLPLWGMGAREVIGQLVRDGFEAIVVAANDRLGARWLGRRVDEGLAEELEAEGVDVCGEHGEYHSLVLDGPMFGRRIVLREVRPLRRRGGWFLEIRGFELR